MLAKLLCRALPAALAAGAISARALPEAELAISYATLIRPLADGGEVGSFAGIGGVRIHYRIHTVQDAVGSVVLVPGCSESSLKYVETIHDLNAAGYSVFTLDHRGSGRSQRLTEDPRIVHVERFSDYVDDAETFLRTIVARRAEGPVHMLGHATGALVGAMLLARDATAFASAAFTSPFFQMKTDDYGELVTFTTVSLNSARGAARDFAPGRGDWDPSLASFDENRSTLSPIRWRILVDQWREHPETLMGGESNRWVRETLLATWARDEHARGIGGLPILLLQAADDSYVAPYGQQRFCAVAENCRVVRIPGARHELLLERDGARDVALAEILALFAEAGER